MPNRVERIEAYRNDGGWEEQWVHYDGPNDAAVIMLVASNKPGLDHADHAARLECLITSKRGTVVSDAHSILAALLVGSQHHQKYTKVVVGEQKHPNQVAWHHLKHDARKWDRVILTQSQIERNPIFHVEQSEMDLLVVTLKARATIM